MKKLIKKIAHFFYHWKSIEVTDASTGKKELAVTHRIMDLITTTTYKVL